MVASSSITISMSISVIIGVVWWWVVFGGGAVCRFTQVCRQAQQWHCSPKISSQSSAMSASPVYDIRICSPGWITLVEVMPAPRHVSSLSLEASITSPILAFVEVRQLVSVQHEC